MVQVPPEVQEAINQAIRDRDHLKRFQIVNRQVATTEGADKAYWLLYRATLRRVFGSAEHAALIAADEAEALRLGVDDPETIILQYMVDASLQQRTEPLRAIPPAMRRRIVPCLYENFRYWHAVAGLHMMRCRWYRAYRARTREIDVFLGLPEEQMKSIGGWFGILHAWRAREAMRCGRVEQARRDVAAASEFAALTERKHVDPIPLAMARAELAFLDGDRLMARQQLQLGMARSAEDNHPKLHPFFQVDIHLLLAHLAWSEGNLVGHAHACEQALAIALAENWAWSEARIRRIMAGQMELKGSW